MPGVNRDTWPLEIFQKAQRMRAQGLPWRIVAERLGRKEQILLVQYGRWKSGKLGSRWEKSTRAAAMVRMAEAGIKPGVIAKHFGISVQLVCVSLARRGYDSEIRRLYRDDCIPLLRREAA